MVPAAFLAAAVAHAFVPTLRLVDDLGSAEHGTVTAGPLAPDLLAALRDVRPAVEEWRAVLALYTGSGLPADGRPAIVGSWAIDGDLLRFRPRYPLVAGLDYAARFDLGRLRQLAGLGGDAQPVVAVVALPKAQIAPSTVVTEVYPTASELPENNLRFYVHFSAPMGRGEAYEHVRLLGAAGAAVEAPFLELTEELWDPGLRRLTLFFDPGRIKRGLRPHAEAGPPLAAGASYKLVIDPGWRDARGLPLAAGFEKSFRVTAADRRSPDPGSWRVTPPVAGSRLPLELRFPEPLDHGLLERVVRLRDPAGEPVAGEAEIGDQERLFRWIPESPWVAGGYTIEVEGILEDLAGNNLEQVFDVELSGGAGSDHATPEGAKVTIPFTVRAP